MVRHITQSRKRKKDDTADTEIVDTFFIDEDDTKQGSDLDQIPVPQENAEEKRLRIAKEYISRVKAVTRDADDDEDAELEDEEDIVAARLRRDIKEARGMIVSQIATRLRLPIAPTPAEGQEPQQGHLYEEEGEGSCTMRRIRGHRLAATGVTLSPDATFAYSAAKDGSLQRIDIETGTRTAISLQQVGAEGAVATTASWVHLPARKSSKRSLYSIALSSDGGLLAAAGGGRNISILDPRTNTAIRRFRGHKDAVTGLAWQSGSARLVSVSLDKSVRVWQAGDGVAEDQLFGHQAEIFGVDMLRGDRAVSAAGDRSLRLWKLPEQTQLVFNSKVQVQECVRYVTQATWVSGGQDGRLCVWNHLKKRAVCAVAGAHGEARGGSVGHWVQSLGGVRGGDLVWSGAGDGVVRAWRAGVGKEGTVLEGVGGIAVPGFVNGVAGGDGGRVLVCAVGQEPRMGRWGREGAARNGVVVVRVGRV